MLYDITAITIGNRQRASDQSKITSLAESIHEIGLINPITITNGGRLIAGLHRLQACKELGWLHIDVTVLDIDSTDAELAEIDENLIRNNLTIYEQGQHLLRRNEILEEKGVRAKAGDNQHGGGEIISPPKTTANIATEIGLSERSAQQRIQIARDIEPDVAEIMRDMPIADSVTQLLALARAKPESQREIAAVIAEGNAETITDAKRELKERKREDVREQNRMLIETAAPIATHIPHGQYQTIVIDPPWDWGDEGDADQFGRARPTYGTMSFDEILDLPVFDLATEDAHIYLWITNRSLPKGFALLEKWDFRYITTLTWCKPHFGMGNYFRGQTEQVLFGVRGSLPLLRNNVGTWFHASRGERHSSKPDMFYEIVESCSPGPWLEMFAREPRNGWISWGAEVCTE